jgi:hypothetical protein
MSSPVLLYLLYIQDFYTQLHIFDAPLPEGVNDEQLKANNTEFFVDFVSKYVKARTGNIL